MNFLHTPAIYSTEKVIESRRKFVKINTPEIDLPTNTPISNSNWKTNMYDDWRNSTH